MWWKIVLLAIAGLAVIFFVAHKYGSNRWKAGTKKMHNNLDSARLHITPRTYDSIELEGLPAPVQNYFRAVIMDGQPMVAEVNINQTGTFNLSETREQWKPFTSTQRVITHRPGFDWEALIQLTPGVSVKVHDAYIEGKGILHVSLFGLVSLVNMRGTPVMNQGELMRFIAEAVWYPTKLLPSQGVHWEPVDAHSAKARFVDDQTQLTLLFRFNKNNLIESVRAEARGRIVGGAVVPTPWEGYFSHYARRDGMCIPLEGEVAWMLPGEAKSYWRGRITSISYEFATRSEAGETHSSKSGS